MEYSQLLQAIVDLRSDALIYLKLANEVKNTDPRLYDLYMKSHQDARTDARRLAEKLAQYESQIR